MRTRACGGRVATVELRGLEQRILAQDPALADDGADIHIEEYRTLVGTDTEDSRGRLRTGDRLVGLRPSVTIIGRRHDRSVVLDGESVSRHHAEVRWVTDRYVLVDVGWSNGTSDPLWVSRRLRGSQGESR